MVVLASTHIHATRTLFVKNETEQDLQVMYHAVTKTTEKFKDNELEYSYVNKNTKEGGVVLHSDTPYKLPQIVWPENAGWDFIEYDGSSRDLIKKHGL